MKDEYGGNMIIEFIGLRSKMKDEYPGNMIVEFIGLRSKVYPILDVNNEEKITRNGAIEFQEFYNTLFKKKNS